MPLPDPSAAANQASVLAAPLVARLWSERLHVGVRGAALAVALLYSGWMVNGSAALQSRGHDVRTELDLSGEWRSVTLFGSLSEALGEEVTVRTDLASLQRYAEKHDLSVDPKWGPGKLAEELFEETDLLLAQDEERPVEDVA